MQRALILTLVLSLSGPGCCSLGNKRGTCTTRQDVIVTAAVIGALILLAIIANAADSDE